MLEVSQKCLLTVVTTAELWKVEDYVGWSDRFMDQHAPLSVS